MKKQNSNNLYCEHQILKSKTEAYDLGHSGKINHPISMPEDRIRMKEIKKELIEKYRPFLKAREWFEIDREDFIKNFPRIKK